jgi:hypothetical protein
MVDLCDLRTKTVKLGGVLSSSSISLSTSRGERRLSCESGPRVMPLGLRAPSSPTVTTQLHYQDLHLTLPDLKQES